MRAVMLPSSYGDAADRITILMIKGERIGDAEKLKSVHAQLDALTKAFQVARTPEFDALFAKLKAINETLWDIEDDIRAHERRGDFGAGFVELARSVYRSNDRRAALKREIDALLGSDLREEKSYAPYGDGGDAPR
jgi:uncharacterized protein DUF6165